MAYATGGGGKTVKTSGTVAGDGAITTHVSAIAAGANVTLTSAGDVVTIAAPTGAGNTLDGSYDAGGLGAGRTITADNGGVVLNNTATESTGILQIVTSRAASVPLLIKLGSNELLTLSSPNDLSILGLAGPIQTQHAVEGQLKGTDPTAMDLQYEFQRAEFTTRGAQSGLFAGGDNQIGASGNAVQTADFGDGSSADHSTRASHAVIIGGQGNEILNTVTAIETNHVGIFAGNLNRIKDDPTQRAAVGFNTKNAQSVVLGGVSALIQNSSQSATVGGSVSTIQDHYQSAIIGGKTNTIKCHNDSDGPGRSNAIIASDGATMTLELAQAIGTSDETANFGCNNVILASTGAVITEDPKSCLLVGTNPIATKTGSNRDVSCIIVGGGKPNGGTTDTSGGSTMLNAVALVGASYSTAGTSAAGQVLSDGAQVTTGADFAESFEWNDGNPDNEDRVGLFVKLATNDSGAPNGKIEVGGENTIGPVSAAPGFISNATPMKWKSMYLRDDFDREIKDSEGIPTLNPAYDESHNYTSRSARKEWSPIGMVGRLRVRASTNIGIYPSAKSGLTVNVELDGTVSDAGAKGKYKVIQVVKQKEIWSGPEGVFRRRRQIQDHGYGIVEILVV